MLVVLIGDMDGGEHSVAPVFKISDLGLGKCLPERDPDLTSPCVHDYNCPCPLSLMYSENLAAAVEFFCPQASLLDRHCFMLTAANVFLPQ